MHFLQMRSDAFPGVIKFLMAVIHCARYMLAVRIILQNFGGVAEYAHGLVIHVLIIHVEMIDATMATSVAKRTVVVAVQMLSMLTPSFESGRTK